jgi:fumarate hydratase subunit beta
MSIPLHTPIPDEAIARLRVGDHVLLSGTLVTGRDAAHQWLADQFIHAEAEPSFEDQSILENLKTHLKRGVVFHCGPVVSGIETGNYKFVSAGPTTSMREESNQAGVMRLFNLKGIIGKGGMGKRTLDACQQGPAVYFHAIGGAAALIAESVREVLAVYKLEFGVPEALWVIRVVNFPVIVTMDAHGGSLHDDVLERSAQQLARLVF